MHGQNHIKFVITLFSRVPCGQYNVGYARYIKLAKVIAGICVPCRRTL